MRQRGMALLVMCFALAPPALGDEAFDKLKADYEAAERAWNQKLSELAGEDGSIDSAKVPPHPAAEYLPRLRECAEAHAAAPDAVPVLNFLLRVVGRSGRPDESRATGEWALDQIEKRHVADAGIAETLSNLRYMWAIEQPRLRRFYEAVIEHNKDDEIVARAKLNLATNLYSEARRERPGEDRGESAEFKQAEALFREIASKHAGAAAAKQAEGYVFELDHLQIGMTAPEIVGTDVDEKEIRLSQFAGQVVVLDFWGFW